MQAPEFACPIMNVDGWDILQEDEFDGDNRKSEFWACRDGDEHRLDVSPYHGLQADVVRAFIALDFPDRAAFGSIGPVTPDQILARYWRQRALDAEARIRALAA